MAPKFESRTMIFALLVCLGAACATTGDPGADQVGFRPRGPGHDFDSVEAAAIDAVAYTHLEVTRDHRRNRMAGGTIRALPGGRGFTYDTIVVSSPTSPDQVALTLRPEDVARFHVYPHGTHSRAISLNARISHADRRSVDRVDPAHRPIFVLTSRLSVLAYRGSDQGNGEIADLRDLREVRALASE